MALTPEQIKAREGKLTGSVVKILMTGTAAELVSLWNQMLGREEAPDLSGVWAVRRGDALEPLNLDWYGLTRGIEVTRRGEVVVGKPDWMAATLDGWDTQRNCPVEAKSCGGREPLETIIERYTPQCTWQMLVTGAKECALSVIMGANTPVVEYLAFDMVYARNLFARAKEFMACVESLTPPAELPKIEAPPPPTKEYDMTPLDHWRIQAERWKQAYGAVEMAKNSEKLLKAMVPADAKEAFGHGIRITRNRAGAMSLREIKS